MSETLPIQGSDLWVKIVEFLQQNWATIEPDAARGVCVYFISDTSHGVRQHDFRLPGRGYLSTCSQRLSAVRRRPRAAIILRRSAAALHTRPAPQRGDLFLGAVLAMSGGGGMSELPELWELPKSWNWSSFSDVAEVARTL